MRKIIVLAVCCVAVSSVAARADDWRGPANYPARVVAFAWSGGAAVLDVNHPATFGSWTIAFPASGLPLMEMTTNRFGLFYDTQKNADGTLPLICTNAVSGQHGCTIWLTPAQGSTGEACSLVLDIPTMFPLSIACPSDVTFQR
jgi:hypothetical protein